MTTSALSLQYALQTGILRLDLLALDAFVEERLAGRAGDEEKLFWDIWHPVADLTQGPAHGSFDNNPPPLPDEIEAAFLEKLAELERLEHERVAYQPDASDSVDISDAIRYVHIAAARALRLQARDGYSDDVRQTLDEIRRVLSHPLLLTLGTDWVIMGPSLGAASEAPMDLVSFWGVGALVLRELFRIKYLDGEYEDAFQLAVESLGAYEAVSMAFDFPVELRVEIGSIEEADIEDERASRAKLGGYFPLLNLNPQEVVNTFEGLRLRGKAGSWRLVALRCSLLALTTDEEWTDATVLNADGEEDPWDVYWHRAQGWAEAQLGPNELREYQRREKEEASEIRLKRYFFGEIWDKIPQKAQERLVNADMLWFSEARTDIGAILNELQVAAETMCHTFLWEPLQQAKGNMNILEFLRRDNDLKSKGFHPTLLDYAWVCRRPFFKTFVQGQGVSEDEHRFLVGRLPAALDNLRKSREPAQHDPKKRWRREEVEPFVQSFLGIGLPGVLRRLAEVGPKLTTK